MNDLEREVLEFEKDWRVLGVPKDRAIREWFGFSPERYYMALTRALEDPGAVLIHPQLVMRLRSLTRLRRRLRWATRLDEARRAG